ncbi:hypothetical protein F4804DRAFT_342399 [Jackrogersella minutella]|nr:hypothetical protein F4804DRAFT_342399 [Jackrogersella minutella]
MSCFRLALKGVLESCVNQGAWIWVSGFRKGNVEARVEDFKMFNEAATGLWGSMVLIWRMKGKHLACVGAAIMILAQGFETFSSGIVGFDDEPTPVTGKSLHSVVSRGTGLSLDLSTKAAIYNGIIAGAILPVPVSCSTANCAWPPFPTLAVCGNCTRSHFETLCDSQNGCTYTMPSGTSIYEPDDAAADFKFIVTPSNGLTSAFSSNSQAFISVFDMMFVSQISSEIRVEAYECALWFCLQSLNVTTANGIQTSTMISNWAKTDFSTEANAHFDEFTFVDIPPELYVQDQTRYSIPADSIKALRGFIDSLMAGYVLGFPGAVEYSSDWVEAMLHAIPDLDSWIARLALSITNDIRQTGGLNTNKMFEYSGTAYIMASHVRVNWTARDRVCAWKGDSLPMLFCKVEESIQAQVQDGMEIPEGLNARVGRTEIELVREDDGQWLFRVPINH